MNYYGMKKNIYKKLGCYLKIMYFKSLIKVKLRLYSLTVKY